jgi:hypothetical protein
MPTDYSGALGSASAFDIISRAPSEALNIGLAVRGQRLTEQQAREAVMAKRRDEARREAELRAQIEGGISQFGAEPIYVPRLSGAIDLGSYTRPDLPAAVAPQAGGGALAANTVLGALAGDAVQLAVPPQFAPAADAVRIGPATRIASVDPAAIFIGPDDPAPVDMSSAIRQPSLGDVVIGPDRGFFGNVSQMTPGERFGPTAIRQPSPGDIKIKPDRGFFGNVSRMPPGREQARMAAVDLADIGISPDRAEFGPVSLADIVIGPERENLSAIRPPGDAVMTGARAAPGSVDNLPAAGFSGDVPTFRQWARVGGRTGALRNPLVGIMSNTPDFLPSPEAAMMQMVNQQRLGQWRNAESPELVGARYRQYLADLSNEYRDVLRGAEVREQEASGAARLAALEGMIPLVEAQFRDAKIIATPEQIRATAAGLLDKATSESFGKVGGQVADTVQSRISAGPNYMREALAREEYTESQRLLREQEGAVADKALSDALASQGLSRSDANLSTPSALASATGKRMAAGGYAWDAERRVFVKDGATVPVEDAHRGTMDAVSRAKEAARAVALVEEGRRATVAPRGGAGGGGPVDVVALERLLVQRGFTPEEATGYAQLLRNDPNTVGKIMAQEAKDPIKKLIRESAALK